MSSVHPMPDRLRAQSHWCDRLGSPLYARLLDAAARDFEEGGPVKRLLGPHEGDVDRSVPALRLMASVHRLVLEGAAPELVPWYRPGGGGDSAAPAGDPWPAFAAVVDAQHERLAELVTRPIQTNEPGRTGALLGGFLLVARETGLPLRLLEVGASAGLNLRWDRYRYELGDARWGPDDSPVVVRPVLEGDPPPLGGVPEVVERRGCDRLPLDPTADDDRLTLLSSVWPDQSGRIELLRGALDVAREVPVRIDEASAAAWVGERLADRVAGVATVVFHSIVWQYLSGDEKAALAAALEEAGREAGPDAPLAWLGMEIGGEQTRIRLTLWPGGEERVLADAGFHGTPMRWHLRSAS